MAATHFMAYLDSVHDLQLFDIIFTTRQKRNSDTVIKMNIRKAIDVAFPSIPVVIMGQRLRQFNIPFVIFLIL